MEETQRVDIKLKKETLRIAGVEAAKLGISRRKYLSEIIERTIKKLNDIGGQIMEIIILLAAIILYLIIGLYKAIEAVRDEWCYDVFEFMTIWLLWFKFIDWK